jgi:error-prone DNA polymerase
MNAKKNGIRAHIGSEITMTDGSDYPLLVQNRTGYQNLCRLITLMKMRARKGEGAATLDEMAEHSEGLICLTGGDQGPLAHAFSRGGMDAASTEAARLVEIFGRENVYAEIQRHFIRDEEARNHAVIDIARRLRLRLLATNGVCHANSKQREVFDVLTCIHNKVRLETAGRLLARNSERYLKPSSTMSKIFADLPEAIANTRELSSRLDFEQSDLV